MIIKQYIITISTIIALTVFIVPSPSFAYLECLEWQEPVIVISPELDRVVIDHSKSVRELIKLSDPEALQNGSMIPAGLTRFEIQLSGYRNSYGENLFHVRKGLKESGEACAQITRFELSMRIATPVIFIAAEIPYGTCSYHEVMAHEYKHMQVAYTMLNDVLPITEGYIRNFLAHQGVVKAKNGDEANRILSEGIDEYFKGLSETLLGLSRKLQIEVDSEEEYSRLAKVCDGEISRIINQAVRNQPDSSSASKKRSRQYYD